MADEEKFEYTCTLSPATLQIARDELNEDPSTRLLELKSFRDRLKQYPGLKARLDPEFLIRFLRARKFDQERAFDVVLNYYRMRKDDPEIFAGLKPSNITRVLQSGISYPHTLRDRKGRRIYFIFAARINTTQYTIADVFKGEFINLSKMIEDEETQVRGITLLVDYKNFSMLDFFQFNLEFGKRTSRMWQDAVPVRTKNCLIVNEPHFVDLILGLFTQFLKAKMISRMRCIGTDWKKLHEYIDPACLPPEYGGTLQELPDHQSWVETLMQSDQQMEDDCKFGFVDYTIGKETSKKQQDAISNMAGTYKKIE